MEVRLIPFQSQNFISLKLILHRVFVDRAFNTIRLKFRFLRFSLNIARTSSPRLRYSSEMLQKLCLGRSTLRRNFLMEKLPGNTELKVTTEDKVILDLIKVIHSRKFLLSRYPTCTHTHTYTQRVRSQTNEAHAIYHLPLPSTGSTVANYNHAFKSRSNEWNEITFPVAIPGAVCVCGSVSKSSSNSVSVTFKAVAISHAWDKVRSI